jgi:NADPH:quinone reductase-like Zn-dependent oxidoreductase
MKAIGLLRYLSIDDPESLIDCQIPTPDVHERDLLVRVEAISVNPVDTKVRAPKPKVESSPRILGWDAAGVVEKVAPRSPFLSRETKSTMLVPSLARAQIVSFIWLMNE